MENVILDDSPLAEFLEGMPRYSPDYGATSSNHYVRPGERSRLDTAITRCPRSRHPGLCAARPVDTPVENQGQAPTASADTRAAWLHRSPAHCVFGNPNGDPRVDVRLLMG